MTTISPAMAAKTRASMEGASEVGVGREGEGDGVGGVALDGPEEGVGEQAHHVLGALVVLLAVFALSGLLGGVVDEGLDAGVFGAELIGGEGLAVVTSASS